MRKPLTTGIVIALVLAGCSFYDPDDVGKGAFPTPGPVPPAGATWESLDGTAGITLLSDQSAEVWGLPWYGDSANCREEDFQTFDGIVEMTPVTNVRAPFLRLTFTVTGPDGESVPVENRPLDRDSRFEGWSVLYYVSCELFPDGHDVELHMVEAAGA